MFSINTFRGRGRIFIELMTSDRELKAVQRGARNEIIQRCAYFVSAVRVALLLFCRMHHALAKCTMTLNPIP